MKMGITTPDPTKRPMIIEEFQAYLALVPPNWRARSIIATDPAKSTNPIPSRLLSFCINGASSVGADLMWKRNSKHRAVKPPMGRLM